MLDTLSDALLDELCYKGGKPKQVNKFGSVKALINENERLEKAGIFVIHPYSNFRLVWDMLTFVMLGLNILLIPIFMAFPIFEFTSEKVRKSLLKVRSILYYSL